MALEVDSWAVDGGTSSARLARLQLEMATSSGNGVGAVGALEVLPLEVPGGGVRVAPGPFVARGAEAMFQGSYYGHNVGTATVPITPTDSSGPRSDLVVVRVEDPTVDGTPWTHDPSVDPIYYFRVIEDVSAAATVLPPSTTGVALARIDLPASTGTVTAEMITDLRAMIQPRSGRVLRVQRGGSQTGGEWDKAGDFTSDFERWPQHDWTVTIPPWATQVQVLANWDNVFYDPNGGSSGTYDARGLLRIGLLGSQFITTTESAYNFNPTSGTNGYRCSTANRDQIPIPAAMRGETVQVRMYAKGTAGQQGLLVADNYANFSVDLEFLEVPAPEAQL
ncbi:hypothetical protein [Nocardiopsis composta]|uniref:Uncharacterized protein n=1 Tax=Nocardiopsis composta TaxID=157465 RepID=A0A7W8QKB6_9ACTN|nr:hypothetical protein [Nocardiopsis composta]MBB5431355.1 hypothetical protein [Nocardiopsis composta]